MTTTDPLRPNTDGWPVCPSDSAAQAAWKQILDIARAHALLCYSHSLDEITSNEPCVVIIATPEAQRFCEDPKTMRDDVLTTHRMRETVAIHGQDRP